MKEIEVWSELTSEEFTRIGKDFNTRFGNPKIQKRLTIEVNDYDNEEIDTRIKITNAVPKLIQKVGDWKGTSREEEEILLQSDSKIILALYKMLRNVIRTRPGFRSMIYFYNNYLWKTNEFEIKLFHQSGKTDAYGFEVELIDESVDLIKVCQELGLKPDMTDKGREFWDKWNDRINLDIDTLTDEQLVRYISDYLNFKVE